MTSDPPRPSVVMSRVVDTPWKPATTGVYPSRRASSRRSGRISRILARVWSSSVMMPACEPVKEAVFKPCSARAIETSDMEMRSPAVRSMSSSRFGLTLLTWSARRRSSSVNFPMAETTTTTWSPARTVRATCSATARMRSASPTLVPPNFWTTRAIL